MSGKRRGRRARGFLARVWRGCLFQERFCIQTSWLALAPEDGARKLMPEEAMSGPVPNWVRLLAATKSSQGRIKGQYALRTKGNLEPKLRAQMDWIAAHLDRAWYALGQAEERLRALGEPAQRIVALAGPWDEFSEKERAAFRLVRISTVLPMAVADDDFAPLLKHYTGPQAAEIMHRICEAAYFNRVTEAAQLPLE
jgi:alkylhydroperoxidase family enzyme